MTTLRQDLPLRLLRAATAVVAAVLLLLGAVTLQNLAAHTDDAVPTLTGAAAMTATAADVDDSSVVHVDGDHGVAGIFCALLGLAAMIVGAVAAVALVASPGRALFVLSRLLARVRRPRSTRAPSAVSLTVLSIARV